MERSCCPCLLNLARRTEAGGVHTEVWFRMLNVLAWGLAACAGAVTLLYAWSLAGVCAQVVSTATQPRTPNRPRTAVLTGSAPSAAVEPQPDTTSAGDAEAQESSPPTPTIDPLIITLEALAPDGWVVGELQSDTFGGDKGPVLSPQTIDLLREFRCIGVASKFFQRGQRLVIARAYKFEDHQGAFGAYTLMREGSSSGLKRGDTSSEDDQSVSIWQDSYYVNVYTTAEDDDEAKQLVLSVAENLVASIKQHSAVPALMSRLPQLDRILGSERLVMGPSGARRVAHVPYIGSLAIETSQGAVSADYQFRDPVRERLKLLIVTYQDAQSARAAYGRYAEALADSRTKEVSGGSTLFKLADAFLLCQLKGNQLAIIDGARKRISPYILSRQLNL